MKKKEREGKSQLPQLLQRGRSNCKLNSYFYKGLKGSQLLVTKKWCYIHRPDFLDNVVFDVLFFDQ